jgi:hypothetical protein
MMPLQDAATALLNQIHAPQGAVNILPLMENGGRLIVWVDSLYMTVADQLPLTYQGYPVTVERRPRALG